MDTGAILALISCAAGVGILVFGPRSLFTGEGGGILAGIAGRGRHVVDRLEQANQVDPDRA